MQFAAGTELNWFVQGLRILMAWLCEIIYSIIANLYNLFMNLTKINLLDNDTMSNIYQRITLILSIVMVFYVTFQFVKYVVQPDTMTDKEKGAGNIVFKMVAVVLLIAYVPMIFGAAMKVQNVIIEQNVIGKILLGKEHKIEDNYGGSFAFKMLDLFYSIPDEYAGDNCDGIPCIALYNMNQKSLIEENKLPYLTTGINAGKEEIVTGNGKTGKVKIAFINFKGLEAVLVGGVIAYMLLLYCIDVGTRWAQLIYLQIVSPIPIIGYLSPKKDGIFQKWCKQCITTYLDIFLRISIIYLILYISSLLLNADTDYIFENVKDESEIMQAFIKVALILGLLVFAKKAPKLISELFPKSGTASGNFGLSAKDRGLKGVTRVAGAASGAAIGAAAGLATGFAQGLRRRNSLDKNGNKKGLGAGIWGATKGAVGGTIGGATRGLVNGGKKGNVLKNSIAGAKNQVKASQRFGNREENGYGFVDQVSDRIRSTTGMRSRTEMQETKKAPISRHDEALKKVADTRSKIEERALSKLEENGGKGGVKAQTYDRAKQRLKDLQENNEVRSREFRVGKYKDEKIAQSEYEKAVRNAKLSVDKSRFITTTPETLDQARYNEALTAAEKLVDKNKFLKSDGTLDQTRYNNAVTLAKASVNKSNFITPASQQFDQAGYDAAVAKAAESVDARNYTVSYKTEAEAQDAYNRAVREKTDAIDRNMFATDDEYNEALKEAAETVNKDMYIKGYETQAEAEEALAKEINSQKKVVTDAKDEAVREYVANSNDGAIDNMLDVLATEIHQYNTTAPTTGEYIDENGNVQTIKRHIDEIDKSSIKSNFEAFSEYVKSGEIKQAQDINTKELIRINTEINRIKSQQEGSGINDGKK